MASTYRYAVKVRRWGRYWNAWCQGCEFEFGFWGTRGASLLDARHHAAVCEPLHRANWDAACPSCKLFGKIAPACPVCLGRGWVA